MAVNTITGTTGNDLLQGQQLSGTNNLISGLAGTDTLIAATIADTISGGAGNDSISFGTGLAINGAEAVGGAGADSFYANGTKHDAKSPDDANGSEHDARPKRNGTSAADDARYGWRWDARHVGDAEHDGWFEWWGTAATR